MIFGCGIEAATATISAKVVKNDAFPIMAARVCERGNFLHKDDDDEDILYARCYLNFISTCS